MKRLKEDQVLGGIERYKKLVKFFEMAGRLKSEPRRGWMVKAHIAHPESVADHTFRTAFIAMVLGEMKGLDSYKMVKMALIHDLEEAILGDVTPEEAKGQLRREEREREALKSIMGLLPKGLQGSYGRLWKELRAGGSPEAKLVQEIDSLEMALQAKDYLKEGFDAEGLKELFRSAEERSRDGAIRGLLQALVKLS